MSGEPPHDLGHPDAAQEGGAPALGKAGTAGPAGPASSGKSAAHESPRLRTPRHHLIVRPSARTRRRAITAAGVMLLVAAALGVVTAVGVFQQAGASHSTDLPQNPVGLQGTVTEHDGTSVEGADVRVVGGQNENTTNSFGWYYLAPVKPGAYEIEASKPGYQTVRKTVEVRPLILKIVSFELNPGNETVVVPPERPASFIDPAVGAVLFGLAVLLCSVAAFLGGYSAIAHRRYLVAVVGAVAGVITWGFVVGSLLSFVALAILGSLKTGFLEAESHEVPWAGRSPANRRSRQRRR